MFRSKAIDIIKTFSPEELKRFRDFIRSPFHNTNKNVIRLFEIIKKHAPDFSDANFDKQKIFKILFKGKKYNDIIMRILISDLLQLAQNFLVERYLEKEQIERKKHLLTELMNRKVDKLFLKTYNETSSMLNDYCIDDTYFIHRFDVEELRKGFNVARNMQHLNSSNLVNMGENILNYFLIKVSSVIHDISVNRGNFNTEFDENIIEKLPEIFDMVKLSELLKEKKSHNGEILEMYFCTLMINYDCKNDGYYYRLKELFYKNMNKFTHGTKYNLYMSLLNHCGNKHWNDKDNIYRREQFQLFKDMLERDLYSWEENEYMTIIIFRSILSISTMLREFDWMEQFINNYIDKLAPEQRMNMYNYSSAKISFLKSNYTLALQYITSVNYDLFTFKYDVKTLMMQIYYELNYIEEAYNLMDTYKRFLVNNKNVSQSFREWNVNFINFYNKLLNIKSGKNNIDISGLETEIRNTANAASQNWLVEKITELKK
jgi:hypothetical protein